MDESYEGYLKFCDEHGVNALSETIFNKVDAVFNDAILETKIKTASDTIMFESNVKCGDFVTHINNGASGNVTGLMVDEFEDVWALVEPVVSGSELPKPTWFRVELLKVKEV